MLEIFKLKFGKSMEASEESLNENLQFLEEVLSQEDPEFMQSVGKIEIDNSQVDQTLPQPTVRLSNGGLKDTYAVIFNSRIMQSIVFRPLMIHKYPKQVIFFWLLFAGVVYGGVKVYKAHFWHEETKLFIGSYSDLGLVANDYDMTENVEPYYDNVRFSKNVMSLVKMTANIRPSDSSSNNPMISFEIVIQGVSNEPIVEIKDREAEFRDLILRVTEDFTYDDLDTALGKQQLSEAILAKINSNLTDGQIRKVFYKNFVIKP